ncbi:hypothetical protein K439DRAFT_66630 [Ramaria rubella]|nr:hypothetical protein K439DRAFT_66630 [Ramaria rubella]
MAALTANPHNAFSPSWDETIVPSLRKRLETESRLLSKRLSTISITDEGPPPEAPKSVRRTVSPPHHTFGESSNSAVPYPQRPSAIPRPSFSRSGDSAVITPSSSPHATETTGKLISKRQRTQSTPFPFDSAAHPNGHPTNGVTTSSASGSISSRVQSPPLGRTTPTPSRIPTVSSRVRSGSQSSQGLGSLNGGKASLPPSHKFTPSEATSVDSETQYRGLRAKASSSSLTRQRIIDEYPPFNADPSPRALESEFTGRQSSDEERPYQHWYRGDVSRNGGVGEYRVGKRMEMLDIANFGHTLRAKAPRTRPYEEPTPRSENFGVVPRKRAESVSSRERISSYMDAHDEATNDRVLDETPLTDMEETDYERDHYPYAYEPSADIPTQSDYFRMPPSSGNGTATPSSSTVSSRIPSAKSQTRIVQVQPNSPKHSPVVSLAGASNVISEPSMPIKTSQPRGRATPRTKPTPKPKGQKQSKNVTDALLTSRASEASDYAGLADAVPDTRAPLPKNGNWDEVILPTVARRMGIEYEKEDPVEAAKRKARESRVAPAPGTFGYDHTKYKPPMPDEEIPMGEFGERSTPAQYHKEEEQEQPLPPLIAEAPPPDPVSRPFRPRRETMPSPAPFAHYASPPTQLPVSDADKPSNRGRSRRSERQDVPNILVSPPTLEDKMEDEPNAGCCKCVVM